MTDDDKNRRRMLDGKLRYCPPRYRTMLRRAVAGELSPRSAIQAFCLECVGWLREMVRGCTSLACPLYVYRPYAGDTDDLVLEDREMADPGTLRA